jgi:hypothetical protein
VLESPRSRIIAGAVAALVVVGGGIAVFAGGGEEEEAAPTTTTESTTTTTAAPTTTAPLPVAPLTGLAGDYGDRLARPALFVKVDNAPQARPHAGINQADIVFEERVEGNTTRLAAVFHSGDAQPVGPVRSTRTTDVHLIALFGRPVFASSGANNDVLSILRNANVLDVGHNVSGGGFNRDPGRPAPHNLFTATTALYDKAGELPAAPKPVFQYRAEGEGVGGGAVPVGGVALSFGGREISSFTWDPDEKVWLRSHGADPHVDTTGARVAPENVVVLEIGYDFSGVNGNSRPHGITTGEGRALVFTGGQLVEGRWVRPGPYDPLQLLATDGTPIKLTPGQTFVELPPPGGARLI